MEETIKNLAKYNFWDGNVLQLGFMRTTYLNRIQNFTHNKLIKVIVGQRRTGKSYLLRQIAQTLINNGVNPNQILYINKEYLVFDSVNTYIDLNNLIRQYQESLKPEGKVYLLIDEIQNIEGWEKLVNSYAQDYTASYEIFISGSNSTMLSGELATLLSGRYVSFEILPFSYPEYLGIQQQNTNSSTYAQYMQSGGLPELFSLPNEESRRQYVSSVKDTVLLHDIIQKNTIRDPQLLEDIFMYLINNASNLLSINNVTNYLKSNGRKTTYDTVSSYIGYIQDAFLIHKAERYDIKGKEIISGNSKFYANDLSYKNYLYSGFGYGIGYQLENLIYLALRNANFDIYVGHLPKYEVDFIAKRNHQILYVQCAYLLYDPATVTREYAALEAISDHYPKIIVSMDEVLLPSKNGISHVQAWNFETYLQNFR
jgi:uncharacterized protein